MGWLQVICLLRLWVLVYFIDVMFNPDTLFDCLTYHHLRWTLPLVLCFTVAAWLKIVLELDCTHYSASVTHLTVPEPDLLFKMWQNLLFYTPKLQILVP